MEHVLLYNGIWCASIKNKNRVFLIKFNKTILPQHDNFFRIDNFKITENGRKPKQKMIDYSLGWLVNVQV